MRFVVMGVSVLAMASVLVACDVSGTTPPTGEDEAPAMAVEEAPTAAVAAPVSAAEEAAQGRAAAVFPVRFRGNWDYAVNGCDKDESGTRFTITENQIKGYESTAKLLTIEQVSADEIRARVHLESADGDDTYDQVMSLSPVEGVSMRIDVDGESSRAYRCDKV